MNDFLLSVFVPLASGGCMVLVLRVSVAQPIEWVKAHADDIAARGVAQDKLASKINGGKYVALNVERA